MANIIPNVSLGNIIRQWESPLETTQSHVVLTGIETTQSHIIPELRCVKATLQKSFIEPKGYFRLVSIEVVGSDRGYGLHAVVLVSQYLLIHREGFFGVVEQVVDSSDSREHAWFVDVLFLTSCVDLYGPLRLVLPDCYFCKFYLGDDHLLVFEGGNKLLLSILYHSHLELALANPSLPPPIIVLC